MTYLLLSKEVQRDATLSLLRPKHLYNQCDSQSTCEILQFCITFVHQGIPSANPRRCFDSPSPSRGSTEPPSKILPSQKPMKRIIGILPYLRVQQRLEIPSGSTVQQRIDGQFHAAREQRPIYPCLKMSRNQSTEPPLAN